MTIMDPKDIQVGDEVSVTTSGTTTGTVTAVSENLIHLRDANGIKHSFLCEIVGSTRVFDVVGKPKWQNGDVAVSNWPPNGPSRLRFLIQGKWMGPEGTIHWGDFSTEDALDYANENYTLIMRYGKPV